MMHGDSRVMVVVCLATTSLPAPCLSTSTFPGSREEPIFEAFRRGDPSRSRKSGGSGLGLAVVKAIAEAHGGSAVCQPGGRGGTLFLLSWPLLHPDGRP